jgi:hypothetical protein
MFMSEREWIAYSLNPAGGGRFLGTAVHKATAETLEMAYPERFIYNRVGPDFIDTVTGKGIELTTPGQVGAHMAKPAYGGVTFATYTLPK